MYSTKALEKIEKYWMREVKQYCKLNVPIILVGNKVDLRTSDGENNRKIPQSICTSDVGRLKNKFNISTYLESSIKYSNKVSEIFETALYHSLCDQKTDVICNIL